jgi:hypothetical protein
MSFLLGLFRLLPLKWWLIGGAVAVVVAAFATQTVRIRLWQHDYAEARRELVAEKAERAVERDQAKDAAIAAGDQYRALEASMQRQKEEAEHARQTELAANARVIAGLSAQLGGVRDELAAYASGSREPSGDSLPSCIRRAEALGAVLAESLRVQEELAADAEVANADTRALLSAWPRP